MGQFFLEVVALWLYCAEIETLTLCTCTSPALQLLQRGLFPCAPLSPSLAVDLNMLEFVNGLFVNAAPNTTAWCETLESFLGNRRYKLSTRVSSQFFYELFLISSVFLRIACASSLVLLCSGMLHWLIRKTTSWPTTWINLGRQPLIVQVWWSFLYLFLLFLHLISNCIDDGKYKPGIFPWLSW